MIDTPDEVLQALQNDAVFMSNVGKYIFKSGQESPSLVILSSNQQIPGIEEYTGLEVVINRVPDTSSRALIAGCSIREKIWTIYLVQYENADPNSAVAAADRILELAPGATYNSLAGVFQASDMAGVEQVVVKIPAHSPLIDLNT